MTPVEGTSVLRTPTRQLGWGMVLLVAATVAVFALEPVAGGERYDPDPTGDPDRPWYARYASWLEMLVRLEFMPQPDNPAPWQRTTPVYTLFAVGVTMMVAGFAAMLSALAAIIVLGATGRRRQRRPRHGTRVAATALAVLIVATPLGWLAATLAVLAGKLNDAAGTKLLPTMIIDPGVQIKGSVLKPMLHYLHQSVFPAALLALCLTPLLVRWARPEVTHRLNADPEPDTASLLAGLSVLRRAVLLLPVFAVGAVVIELTSGSYGASHLLFDRRDDDSAYATASAVLLLGGYLLSMRWLIEVLASALFEPARPRRAERSPRPERLAGLWRRLRADRTARLGALIVAGVLLAAGYVRLWFAVGPHDVVTTEAPQPPSAAHWLGVDILGHDHLVRTAAAVGGSLFVATVAATVATLAGLAWVLVTARLPDRFARPVRAGGADLLAVPAAVWVALPGGLTGQPLAGTGQRLTLGVAIGVLATPVTVRLLWRRCAVMLRSENVPLRPSTPLAGSWLAVLAGALLVEHAATFLLFRLDEQAPTLGAQLAAAAFQTRLFRPTVDAMSGWPWLWYPPAIGAVLLVAGFALLAAAALRPTGEN